MQPFCSSFFSSLGAVFNSRLAEEYQEQSWAAMSELEKELQQIEAQYGEEFGDATESEEEEVEMDAQERNSEDGGKKKHQIENWTDKKLPNYQYHANPKSLIYGLLDDMF